MAQTIKLRRSATQGAIPTTSQLSLGEVAVNTYDGKMYIKKSVGGTESIVEIGAGGGLTSSFTLYEYTASASQTTFSGSDDNSNTLAYDTGTPPRVLVYLNGVLLDYTTDYTATNGTSVVLTSAATTGDLVQVGAYKSTVTSDQSIQLDDNLKLSLGDDSDLELWHTGSNSVIHNKTGQLRVRADDLSIQSYTSEELFITALENGAVKLYYDNSLKLETTNDGVTVTGDVEADEFIGDVRGAVLFKAQAGEALAKGEVVYISGISGNTTVVSKADADDASKMPAFGLVAAAASSGTPVDIYTNGILSGIDTSSYSEGDELFVSTTAGALTATAPTGESAALQKIGKVTRSASSGSIFIVGAGRTNAVPNLNEGKLFVGNSSNQAVADDTVHVDIANSRVGIGTTSPAKTLDVAANGSSQGIHLNISGVGRLQMYADGDRNYFNGLSGNGHRITTTGGAIVDILNGGDVGIGLTSPQDRLHIAGGNLLLNNALEIRTKDTGGSVRTVLRANSSNELEYGWSANGPVKFMGGGSYTERMRIHTNGNVGIGTTSPNYKLDVASTGGGINISGTGAYLRWNSGDMQIKNEGSYKMGFYTYNSSDAALNRHMVIDTNGYVGIGTASPAVELDIKRHTNSYPLRIGSSQGEGRAIVFADVNASPTKYNWIAGTQYNINDGFEITPSTAVGGYTFSNPALAILQNGNVGIGTSSPSQKLTVNGNIYAISGEINVSAYKLNGTYIVDSSRNLVNIGTISSGAITSSTGTVGTSPNTFKIITSTEANTAQGDVYAALEFHVTGAENSTGTLSNSAVSAIKAIDYRSGATSFEDAGIGFYTLDSSDSAPVFRGGFSNAGGLFLSVDGNVDRNTGAGDLYADSNIEAANNLTFNNQLKKGSTTIVNNSSELLLNTINVTDGDFVVLDNNNSSEANFIWRDHSADRLYLGTTTDVVEFRGDVNFQSGHTLSHDGNVILDASRSLTNISNITTTGYLRGPSTFTIDPATHGDDTGTVVIAGNLQVDGTTTTINSTTLTVDDKNITLASGSTNAAAANGAGLTVDCGSGTDATLTYNGTLDTWEFNKELRLTIGSFASHVNTGRYLKYRSAYAATAVADFELKSDNNSAAVARITGTGTADLLQVFDNTTQVFTIEDGGNVGISAASPTDKLDVAGALRLTANISFDSNKAGRIYKSSQHGLAFHGVAGTENDFAMFTPAGQLMVVNPTGTNNVALIPTASGNVGIGLTDPDQKLDVNGNIRIPNAGKIVFGSAGASPGDYLELNDVGSSGDLLKLVQDSTTRLAIQGVTGNVSIGVTTPFTVGGTAKLSLSTANNTYLTAGASNSDLIYSRRYSSGHYQTQTYLSNNTGSLELQPYGGNVGIGTSATVSSTLQVKELGIDTTTTSTTATTQVAIDTFAAATFRSARYTIQVTNSTDSTYHITEILLIHDGTTPQITEYGTIFTGSAEATFDADISSGNVRLLATPATTDSMTFKVVRHCITV